VNLISLAKALVANLGYQGKRWWLNVKDRRLNPIEGADGTSKEMLDANFLELNSKTLEEWRALAGCFFLSVMYAKLPFIPSSRNDTDKCGQNIFYL
jgi:hypothetical protein